MPGRTRRSSRRAGGHPGMTSLGVAPALRRCVRQAASSPMTAPLFFGFLGRVGDPALPLRSPRRHGRACHGHPRLPSYAPRLGLRGYPGQGSADDVVGCRTRSVPVRSPGDWLTDDRAPFFGFLGHVGDPEYRIAGAQKPQRQSNIRFRFFRLTGYWCS